MSGGVLVPGLDASTPLGFLAALGLLRILEERNGENMRALPRLAFREMGRWRPAFDGVESIEVLVAHVRADAEAWTTSAVLGFRYVKVTKSGPARFGGLTPPLPVLRGWMLDRLRAGDHRALAYMSALVAETATQPIDDGALASPEHLRSEGIPTDATVPAELSCLQTFFDFSNRNIQFLDYVDGIRKAVFGSPEWVEGELIRNEPVAQPVPTMGWDTTAKAPGAQYPHRATANRPVTEWLAFRGLVFLPIFGRGRNVQATACRGRRLNGRFIWPIWVPFATAHTIRSLLAYPELESTESSALRALGVAQLFRSRFSKLGKYDAIITPSEPVGGAVAQTLSAATTPGAPRLITAVLQPKPRNPQRVAPPATPTPESATSTMVQPREADRSLSDDESE